MSKTVYNNGEFIALAKKLRFGHQVKFETQSVSSYCHFHGVCFTDGRVGRLLRHPRIHSIRSGAGSQQT
eukprot:362005-Amphidinium_carterae.1